MRDAVEVKYSRQRRRRQLTAMSIGYFALLTRLFNIKIMSDTLLPTPFKVRYTSATPLENPLARYDGLKPKIDTLPKGFQKQTGYRPFPVETIFERDVAIPVRDGTILRADVFRPVGDQKFPALLAFSPYGKSGTGKCKHSVLVASYGTGNF